ncbi:collagen alpha-2(I) chain-like [Moschus berezovskii]|uniref:collagen alpha-2(I) chain-like n=1 Tax=Moschus berezovskii TaxID=68408 RepID=UPI002444765A|nr:collagen alpha-2(I) chain-like [Moschus berezovskii]
MANRTTVNVFGPEFQRLISTPPTESPAQGEPRPEIRVAPGQISRVSCLLRPGQGGGAAAGWGGLLGRAAPGHSVPLGRWRAQDGRRAVPAASGDHPEEALGASARPDGLSRLSGRRGLPGTSPSRVYMSPHGQAGGSREPRCPPGCLRAGEEAQRPGAYPPGIPPPPGPAFRELRVIALASLLRKGLAQAGGGRSPQVPARPTRKPAAAPCAAAPADLNTPAGRAAFPELGAPRAPCFLFTW